ncbi:MAG TPA: potassium-transporting ATPase subunit KdpC [Candidatus Binatia bacterium]|nr:potassium-transporting ATPase subunit KdpC [Candidatus Binatia bacterium]
MRSEIRPAILLTLILTLITGIAYPVAMTAIAQLLFPHQANGSLIVRADHVIGSELIGQNFAGDGYFHPRPSAAGANGYDAGASGGSNLGPNDAGLLERVSAAAKQLAGENPGATIPVDLVTASASGLDPHISPAAAELQVARVAKSRGLPVAKVRELVRAHTEARQFGVLGEPRVNVLRLNLALDEAGKNS